jgi:nucleoside-diphosphate-sugar epimerase
MRILILGGTRFVGLELAEVLLGSSHQVTTASRRPENAPTGAERIGGERDQLLTQLEGRQFDVVVDFICWDGDGPGQVLESLSCSSYVLISTVYLRWLAACQEPGPATGVPDWASLPNDRYRQYLGQKLEAESAVLDCRGRGQPGTVMRLPVMWGDRDHSQRAAFFTRRIADQQPVLMVDGGTNTAQVAWATDVARGMATWLVSDLPQTQSGWDAFPEEAYTVREILCNMATSIGVDPRLESVPQQRLAAEVPEYLEREPLWRERHLGRGDHNLFESIGMSPTPQVDWFARLAQPPPDDDHRALRRQELALLDP